jgi:acetate---CoA ligase (ADP-forming)
VAGIDQKAVARLLRPRSVAIVGASEDPNTIGGRVLNNLVRAGFAGPLHLVSRTRNELLGRSCVRSIDDLPEGVDALVLMVPAEAVLDSVAACARRKVNGVIIFSSGFAEVDDAGKAAQKELKARAEKTGMLIVGPNCLGFTNYVDGVPLTFDDYKPIAATGPGIALIAQSGGLVNAIRDSIVGSGVRVTHNVSTGNEAVVTAEDFLDAIIDDAAVKTVILFLEQVRNPKRLLRIAAKARAAEKSIVLMQPGQTAKAQQAAQSHTGSLTGDHALIKAVLGSEGVAVVESFDALVDVALILHRFPAPDVPGAAVLTNSGAMRGVIFDIAEREGLELVEFSKATDDALRALVPAYMPTENPFDIATLPFRMPDAWGTVAKLLLEEPRAGVLVVSLFPGTLSQQAERMKFVMPYLRATRKPVAFTMLGEPMALAEEFVAEMRAANIPLFRSTERAIRAMAAVVAVGQARQRRKRQAPKLVLPAPSLPRGGPIAEYRSKELLAAAGIPIPRGALAKDVAQAAKIATQIGYPVVLKAQAALLSHKSDAGGVITNVIDAAALGDAWERLHSNIRRARPDLQLDGVLVEEMARPGLEMIIGARRDPDWGAVLMLGMGGIWVETLRDVQLLPADADEQTIVAALKKLRGAPLLHGSRGSKPVDLAAIARVAASLADFLLHSPEVSEIEINPLLAYPEGALALDALIVTRPAM